MKFFICVVLRALCKHQVHRALSVCACVCSQFLGCAALLFQLLPLLLLLLGCGTFEWDFCFISGSTSSVYVFVCANFIQTKYKGRGKWVREREEENDRSETTYIYVWIGCVVRCVVYHLRQAVSSVEICHKILIKKNHNKNNQKMDTEYVPFLLVTANVGSVFEDVSALLTYILHFFSLSLFFLLRFDFCAVIRRSDCTLTLNLINCRFIIYGLHLPIPVNWTLSEYLLLSLSLACSVSTSRSSYFTQRWFFFSLFLWLDWEPTDMHRFVVSCVYVSVFGSGKYRFSFSKCMCKQLATFILRIDTYAGVVCKVLFFRLHFRLLFSFLFFWLASTSIYLYSR